MAISLFGYKLEKQDQDEPNAVGVSGLPSPVMPSTDDGATNVVAGGYFGTYMDLDGNLRTENDFIRRYREMSLKPEVDSAIEDIVSDALVKDEMGVIVGIMLDALEEDLSDSVRKDITDEFAEVLRLLAFNTKGPDIFRRWYVDGRLFFHKILDPKKPGDGVQELRYIDPRKIKKIREVKKTKDALSNAEIVTEVNEYYIFNEKGLISTQAMAPMGQLTTQGIKIPLEAITFVPSGYMDVDKSIVISYLHKAIKPVNQLAMVEDAMVIYILSRAPERRIFYIDVGNLPKAKAEQYMTDTMNKYRNKIVYDASTGEIRDDKKFLSMLEDFWLPRRNGQETTKIDTLDGASNLTQVENIVYFQKKVYQALNVPPSRMIIDDPFNFEHGATITRDELKFSKFIDRLRTRFSELFLDVLRTNLIQKKIMRPEEWDAIKDKIRFEFKQDIYYAEKTEIETQTNRLNLLALIQPYVGTYYSQTWVRKNILQQDDEMIADMDKEIASDQKDLVQNTGTAMVPQQPDPQNQAGLPGSTLTGDVKPSSSSITPTNSA